MSAAHDPAPTEDIRLGPVRVVEVFTAPAPAGVLVADALDAEQVPFEEIRHLCSSKPLAVPNRPELRR